VSLWKQRIQREILSKNNSRFRKEIIPGLVRFHQILINIKHLRETIVDHMVDPNDICIPDF